MRDILLLVLEADKYPRFANEDWVVAARMKAAALLKSRTAVFSADDPPEFACWLQALQKPNLSVDEREQVFKSQHDYFEASGAARGGQSL